MDTNLIEDLRLLRPPDFSWLIWAAGFLLLLAAVARAWWGRRPAAGAASAVSAATDYWQAALHELERLATRLQPEESRAYGMAATTILRRYIEQRFGLHAPLQAMEEFLLSAAHSERLPSPDRERLAGFLGWCDLLKFGKGIADTPELRHWHGAAVTFVMGSRPATAAEPAAAGTAEGRAPGKEGG
jgi:hypothetical protein